MEVHDRNSIIDTAENKILIVNSTREAISKKIKKFNPSIQLDKSEAEKQRVLINDHAESYISKDSSKEVFTKEANNHKQQLEKILCPLDNTPIQKNQQGLMSVSHASHGNILDDVSSVISRQSLVSRYMSMPRDGSLHKQIARAISAEKE